MVHAHGAIWKERGLLSAQGSSIRHKEEILQLLQAVQEPEKVAIMHCQAHQFGQSTVNMGNRLADYTAKEVAQQGILALIPDRRIQLPGTKPFYSEVDRKLALHLKATENSEGWLITPNEQVIVPPQLMTQIAEARHKQTHWGVESLIDSLQSQVLSVRMTKIIKSVTEKCPVCLKNNPLNQRRPPPGVTRRGNSPGDYWQIDFSELPRQNGYRYLLVLVDTFSGWPEAFPCRTNKAREVVKCLLKEIIPKFGVPIGMSSDRGPHFVAEVLQQLSQTLNITWDLHTPWRPQSSGKVERMNQTLKRQGSKICQETTLKWPQALSLALLRIRVQPRTNKKEKCLQV